MAHWIFDIDGRRVTAKNGTITDDGEMYWVGLWDGDEVVADASYKLPLRISDAGVREVAEAFAREHLASDQTKPSRGCS